MPTRRESILLDRQTQLLTVTEVKTVDVNKASVVDIVNDEMPAIYIYSSSQASAVGVESMNTKETWIWEVVLEVWAQDTDMETLSGNIYAKWYVDRTCGGFAIDSELVNMDLFDVDPNRRLFGEQMIFEIKYRHSIGLPFS